MITNYIQELDNGYNDLKGANEYPLWLYIEEYNLYLQNNPNYIYRKNLKKFLKFIERNIEEDEY